MKRIATIAGTLIFILGVLMFCSGLFWFVYQIFTTAPNEPANLIGLLAMYISAIPLSIGGVVLEKCGCFEGSSKAGLVFRPFS